MDKLTGNISPINIITGNIISQENINGNITYGNGNGEYLAPYEGEYEVTPLAFEETVLRTNGMKMTDDVIIKEIPYYETSNESGGSTVYIAGTINFS